MNTLLFSVFDSAAKRFLEPFCAPSVEYAIRSFRATVNGNPEHPFSRFPEDYTLFAVGEFDQVLGTLVAYETPRNLGIAMAFVSTVQGDGDISIKALRESAPIRVDRQDTYEVTDEGRAALNGA